jgi:molybdopterin converting factor small subunit
MFARAKDIAGAETVEITVGDPIQAHAVFAELSKTIPALKPLMPSCRLAVDNRYVTDQSIIDDDSVIALIPPVSGG